jgi:hypothetical protein
MVEGSFLKYPKLLWSNTYTIYLEYNPIEDPLLKQLNNDSNLKRHPHLKPLWDRGGRKRHSYPVMFNIREGHFDVDPMVDRDWRVHPGPLGFSHARRTPDGFDWKD